MEGLKALGKEGKHSFFVETTRDFHFSFFSLLKLSSGKWDNKD
jgi:hypothetical protein